MNLDWAQRFKDNLILKEKKGNDYALKKANSWYLQKLEKQMISKLVLGFDPKLSIAERERLAYSSEDYANYLKEARQAIQEEILADVQYEKQENVFEGLRSLCSLEKKTQNQIGE